VSAPSVRRANESDVEAIVDVHIETWRVAYRGQLPDAFLDGLRDTRAQRAAAWHAGIASARQRVLVAERDGRVIGFASVGAPADRDLPAEVGELYAIYVHPGAWDTGAGRELMRAGLRALGELGYREAILWVLESNARARRFYEKGGWRADGATKVDRRGEVEFHEARYRRPLGRSARDA
jgi:L-amino acid N-acyltransferase YncA